MKILVIKLGALGDVLRTTPLLSAFKREYPGCEITWIVEGKNREALENNPLIKELLSYSDRTPEEIGQKSFDLAVNLDKEPEALEAMMRCRATRKRGFARGVDGQLRATDALSDYALKLGIDDDLKFRKNRMTYQQISFGQVGLEFKGEAYVFKPTRADEAFAKYHLSGLGVVPGQCPRPLIGINTGSGARFAGKHLSVAQLARLAERYVKQWGATVLLLGGEDEIRVNRSIVDLCKVPVINTGSHSIGKFASIVGLCDLVVSGDTTAMHIAIAMNVPVVVFFGSTCAVEIELYGRGTKIVSSLGCSPCYKRKCPVDERCMAEMDLAKLFMASKKWIKTYETAR